MIRNYLKIALRHLLKNNLLSSINIGGLAVGMAVVLLIGLWIVDELSFNKYHTDYPRIGQVMVTADYNGQLYTVSSHPMPLAVALRSEYGDDFTYIVQSTATQLHHLNAGGQDLNASGRYMDAEGPAMLTLEPMAGMLMLPNPNTVLLSEGLALKLFGKGEAIGKTIRIDGSQQVKVGGVYRDIPGNSEFNDMAFIAPLSLYLSANSWAKDASTNWGAQFVFLYAELNPGKNFANVSAQIKDLKLRHVSGKQAVMKPQLFLNPMRNWHLYSDFKDGHVVTSDRLKYIWFYGTIGVFVLLLACINFVNLSTARSEKRAKEVGIRKTMGSRRGQLVMQFVSESLLVALAAFLAGLVLVEYTLPWFNDLAGKRLTLPLRAPLFWIACLGFVFLTGLLAGLYPALYLSAFRPVKVLKGDFKTRRRAAVPGKIMTVVQFTVSIALVIGTIVVYRQVRYGQERPVGYDRADLVAVPLTSGDLGNHYPAIRNELLATRLVASAATSASPLTSIWNTTDDLDWPGKAVSFKPEFGSIGISSDYGQTVGWKVMAGHDLTPWAGDSASLIVNESAVRLMGLKNAIGTRVQHAGKSYTIAGVVRDMVMESPYEPVSPCIFFLQPEVNTLLIRLTAHSSTRLPAIANLLRRELPQAVIDYSFVEDTYAVRFAAERRTGRLAGCFATLAILISCLGLFAMAAFAAEQRTREIGVRKVLGASVASLWGLLSRDFLVLCGLAFGIGSPIAYVLMKQWLGSYAYRTGLSWWIFFVTGLGVVLITLVVVSFQTLRAALTNPVNSLRNQ
jgi:putative ABC transport system permease protein